MKRATKRFLALTLAGTMAVGLLPTNAYATLESTEVSEPTREEQVATGEEYESSFDFGFDFGSDFGSTSSGFDFFNFGSGSFDMSGVNAAVMSADADDETEINEEDPAIMTLSEELDTIEVTDEETGETVSLTEEQKQTILYMYNEYLTQWTNNADVLGVQTPFFLSYNDSEDGLGILGEMLVLSNYTVDQVRNGEITYDDLTGMIMNFYYGDQLGVEYYGATVESARDEALKTVEESGAVTEVQKLLVLNDWLAHNATFDMSYIMNSGKAEDEKPMVAEDPVAHEHYQDVYDVMYAVYEEQITATLHDQIYDGIVASLRQQFYEAAIRQIIYDAALEAGQDEVRKQVYADSETYNTAYNEAYDAAIAEGKTEEEAATAADEAGVAALTEDEKATLDGYVEAALADEETAAQLEAAADEYADSFMTENADAIEADAPGFVEAAFGAEAAAALAEQCDAFVADAEENGVEVAQDEEGNPVYMTVEQLTQQTMANDPIVDLDGDGEAETTANDAIPVYAQGAAAGLTDGILNYWEGTQIGALGYGTAVCLGYSKAYTYLVQAMHSDIYGVDGDGTDMSAASNWKTRDDIYVYDENGNLDLYANYVVDMVRISFAAEVTMFGETEDNFTSDHFWNAVKVDDTWFYIDPCYTDVFVEVMSRDRVETDGMMNHLYFMFSHTSAVELYEGNYSVIKTLYADEATSKIYEDCWFSRIASNTYSDGENFYYIYDSTDLITVMQEMNDDSNMSNYEEYEEDPDLKLVYHPITEKDASSDGDSDYETLIFFNYTVETDDEEEEVPPVAKVYNPETNALEENEFLTELYAEHAAAADKYPSIAITTALYDGKLYFNLANCILSYELETGAVTLEKEYNTVYGLRDKTVAFGGMAFSVVNSEEEADLTVENHPIAGMTIKADGTMYVSIATNYAFISGKSDINDQESYGYEFEETNFNPDYNSYTDYSDYDDSMIESMGYEKEINDNDEFMWSANFVETLDMAHFAGDEHEYEEVTVDAACGHNAFTENRCTECGSIEADTRVEEADTAHGHHYIRMEEQYYTKDDNGNWNTGVYYVCTECLKSIEVEKVAEMEEELAELEESLEEGDCVGHEYVGVVTEWAEDYSSATMDVMCVRCYGAKLDCLVGAEEEIVLAEGVTSDEVQKERVTVVTIVVDEETGEETEEKSYYYDCRAVVTMEDPDGNEITVYSEPAERITREEDKYDRNPFVDVPNDMWYTDAVLWAVEEGITTGVTETEFMPDNVCTRAEAVTFLYRVAGTPEIGDIENPFEDVDENEWYYNAVLWAVEEGITTGYTETTFAPNDVCSRSQIVTLIWRMQGEPVAENTENPFEDVDENQWYYDAVLWAVEEGITTGYTETEFAPDDDCTRAQIVTFLYREFATEE